ncbi:VCBS repeat-containing protein, partial [Planctomycetota bacterium]|nr:VCBS repeat-containing protein [Planctomycetota bacterium]
MRYTLQSPTNRSCLRPRCLLKVTLSYLGSLVLASVATSQSFGTQQVITTSADDARSVYATDLDGDGDADVLSASVIDDKIAWYENQGGGV